MAAEIGRLPFRPPVRTIRPTLDRRSLDKACRPIYRRSASKILRRGANTWARARRTQMTHIVRLNVLGCVVALLLSGCTRGVQHLQVAHSPLPSPPQKREGTILLRQFHFVDERLRDHPYIGASGFWFQRPYAVKGDANLESLLTDYFSEALGAAGYQVIRE